MSLLGVYTTPEQFKEYLRGIKDINSTPKDDQLIYQLCIQMSKKFDTKCNRSFFPRLETRTYNTPHERFTPSQRSYGQIGLSGFRGSSSGLGTYPNVNTAFSDNHTLHLDDDLLQVVELKTNNGDTTIALTDFNLLTGDNYNYTPYSAIQLKINGTQKSFTASQTPQAANTVKGFWGYHDSWNFDNAWGQVDTVQDSPLAVGATTLTVDNVDGVDELGLTPRFQKLQLLRFGNSLSSEYAFVTNVHPDKKELTIKRGVNGTVAAEQIQGTEIFVFRPQEDIHHALLAYVMFAYNRKDNIGALEGQPGITESGIVMQPDALPSEVTGMIKKYKRRD